MQIDENTFYDKKHLAEILAKRQKELNISDEELASIVGITLPTLYKYKDGTFSKPIHLQALCGPLNLHVETKETYAIALRTDEEHFDNITLNE